MGGMAKNSEFIGVQIGDFRFSEHTESITKRRASKDSGRPEPEKFFAYWGCGEKSKYDQRTYTLSQLEGYFGPATHYGI